MWGDRMKKLKKIFKTIKVLSKRLNWRQIIKIVWWVVIINVTINIEINNISFQLIKNYIA